MNVSKKVVDSPNTPYPSMALLFDLLNAPVKWAVIEAAVELDMADILAETSDVAEIAQRIGGQTDDYTALTYFLDAMVSIGLANKENSAYSNTEFATHFLRRKSPVFMGGTMLQSMKVMVHKNLTSITGIIKNGPPEVPQTENIQNESRWKRSVEHLAIYQRAGMGAICADIVQDLLKGEKINKILDIGGGPGLIGAEILRRFPGSKGVLLDLPAIVQLAEKEIEKEGLADRVSYIAGDYNEVDMGGGYDLIWASHNLYFVNDLVSFFKRVKKALTQNGIFICLHEGMTSEKTEPQDIVLMRLSMALEGQDNAFAKGEIASCLGQAGFTRVDSEIMLFPGGPLELVIATA